MTSNRKTDVVHALVDVPGQRKGVMYSIWVNEEKAFMEKVVWSRVLYIGVISPLPVASHETIPIDPAVCPVGLET